MRKLLAGFAALLTISGIVPVLASVHDGGEREALIDPLVAEQLAKAAAGDVLTVFVHAADVETSRRAAASAGLTVVETFDRVGVTVAAGQVAAVEKVLAGEGVTYVEANRAIAFATETSHDAIQTEEVLVGAAPLPHPYDGSGVSIAVIDGGIDGTHPMFQRNGRSKVVRNLKLACRDELVACVGPSGDANDSAWLDMTAVGDTDTVSIGGHGTHVASIAAGVPVRTADGRRLHGAAPGASLVGLSVGAVIEVYGGTSALNWVLEHHRRPCGPGVTAAACPPIRVVNNSWSPIGGGDHNPEDVVSKLQDELVAEGVVVVWAAGNDGGDGAANLTNPYGSSPTGGVITVANYDDGDRGTRDGVVAPTSSRGRASDPVTYPDLAAPGTAITGACRVTLPLCGFGADPDYGTISGTSMAAPHVAGVAALLLQADPALTPAEVEDVLEDTAYQFTAGAVYVPDGPGRNADHTTSFDKGHGLVDAHAAVARVLSLPFEPAVAPRPACAGTEIARDPRGDIPDPAVDVTAAHMNWDGRRVVFKVHVADLAAGNPPGSTGVSYRFTFSAGDHRYFVAARRQVTDIGGDPPQPNAESFVVGHIEQTGPSTTYRTDHDGLVGTFDEASDSVVIWLRPADVKAANAVLAERGHPAMPIPADGMRIRNVLVEADGTRGAFVLGRGASNLAPGDVAEAFCEFSLGAGSVAKSPPRLGPAPPDGVVTPDQPTYRWTSGKTSDAFLPLLGQNASGCTGARNDEACDVTHVGVTVPPGGASLEMTLDVGPPNEVYVYVYAPSGEMVAEAAAGSVRILDAESGVYTIVVRAFVMVEAGYEGTVELVAAAPPPGVDNADAHLGDGDTFEADGKAPENNSFYSCGGPHDPRCVTYTLDLQPRAGRGRLEVFLTSDAIGTAIDDFDFYVYDAGGRQLGGSGNPQTVYEAAVIDIPAAGAYYLVIQPFTASTESPYTVSATLR